LNINSEDRPEGVVVELTAEDRKDAARLLDKIASAASSNGGEPSLTDMAFRLYDARKDRRYFFSGNLFSDPAWDMLLLLYCSEVKGENVSVSALCSATELPQTSALRWVSLLEAKGLLERLPHPTDRRSLIVRLTNEARTNMERYLDRLRGRYIG
jgi:DNA-binding MarR family transcriptional regulator